MKQIMQFTLGLILTLSSLSALAWQVNIKPDDTDKTIKDVIVGIDRNLQEMDAYLTWYDKDAENSEDAFWSWTIADKWERGIKPVSQEPLNIEAFSARKITTLNRTCPEKHRCFLAMVAVNPADNPVDLSTWQASSFLPLSFSAGCERWPGQQVFLSCDDSGASRFEEDVSLTTGAGSEFSAPPSVDDVANESADGDAGSKAETEKPDIFKLVGNKLLYANGQASRFQVIDISDVENPRLESWLPLLGSPREIYVFDDFYVLLQTSYGEENGTQLTVLKQDETGKLRVMQEMALSGIFLESRRRNNVIYGIMQDYTVKEEVGTMTGVTVDCFDCGIYNESVINISALRFNAGQLEKVDETQVLGYSATTAIFPDYLVIANHNPQESRWQTTQIQLFDLSQSDPLVELPTLTVPGQVPSEFHLSVVGQHFRVVYGPEERESGSSLAVYDLSSPNMALLGKVDAIAPGEGLFATRFVDNRAFVVTFERTDPLWVIDLSDATNPTILGELEVPGWSEKLFFHEDKLFAVGIDNQPLETEESRWVSRVALSLFDVADPTNPSLIKRFTPFAGQVDYTYSPALNDERALFLDWEAGYAALPISSYALEDANYLQIVSLADETLNDAGNLGSTTAIQRSLSIESDVLVALGDQALTTLRWGDGDPQRLGELELSTNLTWLDMQNGDLWSAAMADMGYHRFYQFSPNDLETPLARMNLSKTYQNVTMDGEFAVFYSYYPLAIRVIDINTGEVHEEQQLEELAQGKETVELTSGIATEPMIATSWYNRDQPFVYNGLFYIAEWRSVRADDLAFMSNQDETLLESTWQNRWILRSWDLRNGAKEMPTVSIPGRSIAFTDSGHLITQETTHDGQLRLNLLALEGESTRLVGSRDLSCQSYSDLKWAGDSLYVNCTSEQRYYYDYPMIMEDDIVTADKEGMIATDDSTNSGEVPPPNNEIQPEEPSTQILKLAIANNFKEVGSWTFKGYQQIRAAESDIILMSSEYYGGVYYGGFVDDVMIEPAVRDMAIMPPYYQVGCDVYRLIPEQEPELLKKIEGVCPYNESALVLTDTQLWTAEGFKGIKNIQFDE